MSYLFGAEAQGHRMISKVGNLGSKQSYFDRAYVVRVYLFMVKTISSIQSETERICTVKGTQQVYSK